MNLFWHLLPGDQTLDVSNYNTIQFEINNYMPIEVVLVPENLSVWNSRLLTIVAINNTKIAYKIPFEDFVDANGNTLKLEDIKTIVFSVKGNYTNFKNFNLEVSNVSFVTPEVLAIDVMVFEKTKVINYPNPFSNATTIKLVNETQYIIRLKS
jgi:hypothetical protein